MGTPNPKKPLKPQITPEQAAELNRRQAARRQADKRERDRQQAADEAAMLAEAEAQAKAEEEARVAHLADVERRLAEAEKVVRATQEKLDDALTLLALHHDINRLKSRRASERVCETVKLVNREVGMSFRDVALRSWTCTASEASERADRLFQSIDARRETLPSSDEPVRVTRDVTVPCTPVTRTVRNAHKPESNADRSQEIEVVTPEEQAWRDSLGDSPYDPYEDYVERIEAIAEGSLVEDDDDGERF